MVHLLDMKAKQTIVIAVIGTIILVTPLFAGCITSKHHLIYDGKIRTYLIHIPPSYTGETPTPLVIALHGGGGNAQHMEEKTSFSLKADEKGFIVVYPDGTGKLRNRFLTWNAGYCCGYAYENNIDDVGFIKTLIKKLQNTYNINSSRIYVAGHSNGAMLAYLVAAELSSIIAAIAPVAGSIGGYATNNSPLWIIPQPSCPVSIIAIHGKLDSHVPYDGGHGVNASGSRMDLSVNESITFWVQHNGCNPTPETKIINNGTIIVDKYSNGRNHTDVVLYTLANGEHWWPGSNYQYQNFSATDTIWDFFAKHPKVKT